MDSIPVASPRLTPSMRGHLLVFMGAVCISFAAFFVKDAPMDVSMVAFYRLVFGSAALLLAAAARRERLGAPWAVLRVAALAGFLFACDLLVWHEAIVLVGPGIATILANFQVLLLALYGVVFLKERLALPQKLAIPLALIGLALLLGLHQGTLPRHVTLGAGLCLLAACFYTGYILTIRRSQSTVAKLGPIANMFWVSLSACACVGVYCCAARVPFAIPNLRTAIILALLGIVCQSLGWLLLSIGLPYLPPFRAGLILLAQPALAFLWDSLFYGTAVGFVNICGAVLAIAAIGLGVLSPSKAAKVDGEDMPPAIPVSMHPAGESGRFKRKVDE